jgi:hypothetical protein
MTGRKGTAITIEGRQEQNYTRLLMTVSVFLILYLRPKAIYCFTPKTAVIFYENHKVLSCQ